MKNSDSVSKTTIGVNGNSKNWLLSNEPRLFVLSLLGQILGLALLSYGLSFLKTNEVNFWQSYGILTIPAWIVGIAAAFKPSPAQTGNRILRAIPAIISMTMSTVLGVYLDAFSGISTISVGFLVGIGIGLALFEKRLDAQPRQKWLWALHFVLTSVLMMSYIWRAYKYMAPLA